MKKIWNKFFVNFFNGIVILLPVAVTIALVNFMVKWLNNAILEPILELFTATTGGGRHVLIGKTLVFLLAIFTMALIGWGAKIIFINRIFSLGERLLIKVPVMGRVYAAFKQIFSAIFGQGKTVFRNVVVIEYPRKGIYSIGFTTGFAKGELKALAGDGAIAVFLPTTPNPTSGIFLIVPREEAHFLNISVEDGMKLIVSGGAVSPPDL
ncbi:MAG: DUF502 domain-containing protein [Candidatus Omnitrophica bacterium]|nr:DUF502 domain-containing protein [Candidatus Omnitrophota bacterium]MDD5488086.1 DUF502 domain-containing protein [Candidatus Omnitrophota bacterium]